MSEADDIRERFNRSRGGYVRIYREASTLDGVFSARELRAIADGMDRLQTVEPEGDPGCIEELPPPDETKSGTTA